MSTVITDYSPLSSGADAAAGFVSGQSDAKAKALALAYQKHRDDRQDMESDRDYALRKGTSEAQIAHDRLQDQIATAREDAQEKLDPLATQLAQLQIQAQRAKSI